MSDAEISSAAEQAGPPPVSEIDRLSYDVIVVGAGGSGLRAAIEAREAGFKTAIISKSLFGKAHTVMAEGGCAAAMGNVNPNDNWQVHFRDTMRGGKFLNNWRMAELHAREAPDRVWELEAWGAVFDRTKDGKISQRNFGGHSYPRLAHVGDRTGLEMIRAPCWPRSAGNGSPPAVIRREPAAWRCCCSPRPRWACKAARCGGRARCRPPT